MFNKKSLTILLLNLHLAISLKSSNFCSLRQVKKCPSEFGNDCGSNVCSHIKTECNDKYHETYRRKRKRNDCKNRFL